MKRKRRTPEAIIPKLREAEVLLAKVAGSSAYRVNRSVR